MHVAVTGDVDRISATLFWRLQKKPDIKRDVVSCDLNKTASYTKWHFGGGGEWDEDKKIRKCINWSAESLWN
jgi:hypothetical protein